MPSRPARGSAGSDVEGSGGSRCSPRWGSGVAAGRARAGARCWDDRRPRRLFIGVAASAGLDRAARLLDPASRAACRAVVAGLRRVRTAVSAADRRCSLCRGGRFGSPQALSSVRGAVRAADRRGWLWPAPVRYSAGGDEGVVGGRRGAMRAPGTGMGSTRRAGLPRGGPRDGLSAGVGLDAAGGSALRGSTRPGGLRRRAAAAGGVCGRFRSAAGGAVQAGPPADASPITAEAARPRDRDFAAAPPGGPGGSR